MHFTFQGCFIFPFVNLDSGAELGCCQWGVGGGRGGAGLQGAGAGPGCRGLGRGGAGRTPASSLPAPLPERLILFFSWN